LNKGKRVQQRWIFALFINKKGHPVSGMP